MIAREVDRSTSSAATATPTARSTSRTPPAPSTGSSREQGSRAASRRSTRTATRWSTSPTRCPCSVSCSVEDLLQSIPSPTAAPAYRRPTRSSAARTRRTVSSAVVKAQRPPGLAPRRVRPVFLARGELPSARGWSSLSASGRIGLGRLPTSLDECCHIVSHGRHAYPSQGGRLLCFWPNPVPRSAELHPKLRPWTVAATKTLRTTYAPLPHPGTRETFPDARVLVRAGFELRPMPVSVNPYHCTSANLGT